MGVKINLGSINDTGNRTEFSTGATRDMGEGKGRFDLISPVGLMRLARWYELGAKKYDDRDWERGLPTSNCIDSAMRHLVKYLDGDKSEDHLAAVAWNVFAVMHFEKYNISMQDIPTRGEGGEL